MERIFGYRKMQRDPKIFMHINGNSYQKYKCQRKNSFSSYKNFTCVI